MISEPLWVYYIVYGPIFKNRGEDTLRCPYKDYSRLNRWQANRDLLSAIYFSVMTHRWKGKKVSILPPCDLNPGPISSRRGLLEDNSYRAMHRWKSKKVSILPSGDLNPGPVSSRRGLLEDSPYRAVGATVHHAMSHNRAPRVCGDLGMSCGHFHKMWIHSHNVCSVVHAASNTWAPLGG
jgi:hypothetical protein